MKDVFKYSAIQQGDLNLLFNWYNSFFFNTYFHHDKKLTYKKFKNKINKLKKKDTLEIITIDNIRVGARIKKNAKKIIFLNPIFYIHRYVKLSHLIQNGIIRNELRTKKILNCYSSLYNDFQIKNINIVKDPIKKLNLINYKKILILGPYKRNIKIIKFLQKDNNDVVVYDKKIQAKQKILNDVDLIISSGYAYLINKEVVHNFKDRIINLHATFLPWGKGIGTLLHSLLLNEPTGISIHLIDEKFDTGEIIYRKILNPNRSDTTRTFYNKLISELNLSFIKNWKYIKGNNFRTHDQKKFIKKNKTPYFSRLEFEKLIEILPYGYDTKLFEILVVGYMCRSNRVFYNYLLDL